MCLHSTQPCMSSVAVQTSVQPVCADPSHASNSVHSEYAGLARNSVIALASNSVAHNSVDTQLSISKSACIWLLDDSLNLRQDVIRRFNEYFKISIRFMCHNLADYETGSLSTMLRSHLKSEKPFLVWCRLKGFGGSTKDSHGPRRLTTLISLCRIQTDAGRHFLIESNAANCMFKYGQLLIFADEKHVKTAYIRLCNLGVRHPQSGKPVSSLCKLITSYEVPSSVDCNCGVSLDKHVRNGNRFMRHYEEESKLSHACIPEQVSLQAQFISLLFALCIACTSQAPEVGLEHKGTADF